ncbi:hypothetical protein [Bacillus cihuensis]|uniref:hypothetical protein n=1 Tax=Bacillus cihuensis TaxID=1208599 RepID=UPI00048FEB92|nr:hypothetical protein [Bacillus cihuensis]
MAPKPTSQRTVGSTNPENQPSPHRNPATRMESQQEVAASREPIKHLTQWEIQQKIDARKANTTPSENTLYVPREGSQKIRKQKKSENDIRERHLASLEVVSLQSESLCQSRS